MKTIYYKIKAIMLICKTKQFVVAALNKEGIKVNALCSHTFATEAEECINEMIWTEF